MGKGGVVLKHKLELVHPLFRVVVSAVPALVAEPGFDLAQPFLRGFVYGALVESFSCEQNARMMAMQSASNSARDMLAELDILYNRARQAAITQEITEVIAGAKSQKKKRK